MTAVGADVAQLRALAQQMDSSATQLRTLQSSLRGRLMSSPWRGNDAQGFREAWDAGHRSKLEAAAHALESASKELRRNADEQDRTSAATPGGAFNPGELGRIMPWLRPGTPVIPLPFERWFRIPEDGLWHGQWSPQPWRVGPDPLSIPKSGSIHGVQLRGDAQIDVSAGASADAHGKLGLEGLDAGIHARAYAGILATASASATYGILAAQGSVSSFTGVEAKVDGNIHAGRDGLSAGGEAGAFAGERITATGSVGVSGVKATGTWQAWGGIGAEAHAHVSLKGGKISVDYGAGAAFKVGAGTSGSIEFDPGRTISDCASGAKGIWAHLHH